jgi:hypothetical protein
MNRGSFLLVAGVLAVGSGTPDAKKQGSPVLPNEALKNLAGTLRGLLVQAMPATLYEASPNWGHKAVPRLGKNLGIKRGARNDGTWRKIRLSTRNLASTLVVELRDWKNADPERMTFHASLAFDAGVDFEQQIWQAGLRLYSGSLRARMRVHLNLDCEVLLKADTSKSLLPDIVFRLRVVKSDLKYDKLVVEHVAGIGGTGAKVLGDALHAYLQQRHPELERNLQDRANAAIVKAADTREVRLSLGSLLNFK